ncbi:lactate utilization protein [Azospirillum melinis]|uniref:Lactate utilization protein n=1 Tax=Azospirillum melinis TaxID=328839 RepID=A0ABX2K9G5_9PROT|nr:lactate utilization protein [Azospirillum melinis]MBP2308946.1 L-lactate dehydrogenase complex protein LldG [Azospirillum melinis]NUA99322.1 lactate utilization protein [Azospirillum melinis]
MSETRNSILTKLRKTRDAHPLTPPASDFAPIEAKQWAEEERLPRIRRLMEAVHTEFLDATEADWPAVLREFLAHEGVGSLIYAPATDTGKRLVEGWDASSTALIPYDRPLEDLKPRLFDTIEAGLTTTRGAIAETGSLILWPTAEEPRTLSLVPHIHIALLRADALYDTFLQAMRDQGWAQAMPTNVLLVSGPSKTADIEQTLAYGVHGPKRLVVLVVHP